MKISIVMPTYNSEKYISEMLFCLKNQTYENYELIVADGGSSDSTLELIKSFNFKDITIISEPDSGIADALNKGFKLATGDILCWQNSDDVIFSNQCLHNVAEKFSTTSCDFLIGKSATISVDGFVHKVLYPYIPDKNLYCGGDNVFTGSLFFNRKMWEIFGQFSTKYRFSFEFEIIQSLAKHGKGAVMKDLTGGLRVHADTVSANYGHLGASETPEILGRGYTKPSVVKKLLLHAQSRLLLGAVCNLVSPESSGLHWKSIYSKHSVNIHR